MCGAATESILLALAIAKTGEAYKVAKDYNTNTGLKKITDPLIVHANSHVKHELPIYTQRFK